MPGEAARAFRARVEGRVQGVGFRWSAQRQAARLGLMGYVRNLPDGAVEVVAEGDPRQLDQLRAWLRRGPPGAHVRETRFQEMPADGTYRRFSIED